MYKMHLFRGFLVVAFFLLAKGTVLHAQFFQASMTNQGSTLIVKIKPNGGNITTAFANMEFFIRYPNTTSLSWSAPIVNTTNFPNAVIQKNDPYTTVPDAGYTIVRFFLPPGTFTTGKTYTNATEYEIFRTTMTGAGAINIEMMHREDFTPYYLALDSETGDLTSSVKFYGAGASPAGAVQSLPLSVVVPLDLLDFNGQTENGVNKLNWKTANEVNTSHFSVEKSVGNSDKFTAIGEVKTYNLSSSTPQYYTFTDAQPSSVDYYRLKMVDRDGQYKYSKTVSLARKSNIKIDLYPNPVTNTLNVALDSKFQTALVAISDATGRILVTQSKSKDSANNGLFVFDTEYFANGVYSVSITIDGKQLLHKVVISK